MRDQLFIRITNEFPQQLPWLRISDKAGRTAMSQNNVVELAAEAAGCQVIVFVPGQYVLLTHTLVPSRQRQHILNAVPYALEEQLADDIDDLHFALGPRDEDGTVHVAVVKRQQMANWVTELRTAGIEPDIMLPDTLATPWAEDSWSLLVEAGDALLRLGRFSGCAIDGQNIHHLLAMITVEQLGADEQQTLNYYDVRQDAQAPDEIDNLVIKHQVGDESALQVLAHNYSPATSINLIQGQFSRREQYGKLLRPWRATAALLLAVLVVVMGQTMADHMHLKRQQEHMNEQINLIFTETFPQARNIVNARERMAIELKQLQTGGSGDQGFLELLSTSGAVLALVDGMTMRQMNYRDGNLDLALTIGDLQELEQLKEMLAEKQELNVELQSATTRDTYVEARLRLQARTRSGTQ